MPLLAVGRLASLFLLLVVVLLGPAAVVDAQVGRAVPQNENERPHARYFNSADKNFDKRLTQEEFYNRYKLFGTEEQAKKLWAGYIKQRDKDGDGELTWDEFRSEL